MYYISFLVPLRTGRPVSRALKDTPIRLSGPDVSLKTQLTNFCLPPRTQTSSVSVKLKVRIPKQFGARILESDMGAIVS